MNEYKEIVETHNVVNGRVCCKKHCCTFHDYTEKEFQIVLEALKDNMSNSSKGR